MAVHHDKSGRAETHDAGEVRSCPGWSWVGVPELERLAPPRPQEGARPQAAYLDAEGNPLKACVHPADLHNRRGAERPLGGSVFFAANHSSNQRFRHGCAGGARRPASRACNRAATALRNQRAGASIAHGFRHETARVSRVLLPGHSVLGGRCCRRRRRAAAHRLREGAATHCALLAEEQEARQHVRALPLFNSARCAAGTRHRPGSGARRRSSARVRSRPVPGEGCSDGHTSRAGAG